MGEHPKVPPPSYDFATGSGSGFTNPQFSGESYPHPQYASNPPYPPPQPANYNTPILNPDGNYASVPPPQSRPPTVPFVPRVPDPVGTRVKPEDVFSDAALAGFSDKAIRRAFIRKVYLILMTQLLVTVGFVCLFMFVDAISYWVQRNSWFYYVSYGTFLTTYIVLICIPSVRRHSPGNYICLSVFTLAFSYMCGTISSYYTTDSVLIAMGITALVCLSISLFAIQTKIDFTMCSGLLFVLVMVLFFFGMSCLIVYMTVGYSKILDCVWGGLAALVFGLFLVYDTQMIVGGRKHQLSPEEYISGALQLYMDVVYLFLIILSLFGKSN